MFICNWSTTYYDFHQNTIQVSVLFIAIVKISISLIGIPVLQNLLQNINNKKAPQSARKIERKNEGSLHRFLGNWYRRGAENDKNARQQKGLSDVFGLEIFGWDIFGQDTFY